MDLQLNNALFLVVTTLAVFFTVGVVAKLSYRRIKYRWLGAWMVLGVGVTLIQIQGAALPRITVDAQIPRAPEASMKIEPNELVPQRSFDEWRESSDKFDEKQDERISENIND